MNDPTQMIVGGLVRVAQGFAAAAPTLLVGLVIAAILRYYLGRDGICRLFGGNTIRSLPQSWLIGMLLPVCSIGVLPILREMRRAGMKPGAMAAFALSAPLFNPLSLLYGLTLSRPLVIILFAIGSLVIVTALGLLWDAIQPRSGAAKESAAFAADPVPANEPIGVQRLAAVATHIGREATGPTLALTLLALSGLAILAAVFPYGALQTSVEQDDPMAPLTMLMVAVPVYATPMLAMSQLGMMFQHANSPGAAFTLLILGTGANLATPYWFSRQYGWKASGTWFLCLLLIVLGISYAVNQPLIPAGVEPAGHTHAFDIYANPLPANQANIWNAGKTAVAESIGIAEAAALIGLGLIAVLGLVLRGLGIDESRWQNSSATLPVETPKTWDMIVPRSVIGTAMLVGLVALSVVACFAYYPPPQECLEEIRMARTECLSAASSGDTKHALFWLPVWEEWSRRLEVATFLRRGQVRPYQRMQGYLIRKKLELLEHELEHDPLEPAEIKAALDGIYATNTRWVNSFRTD
ncbi:permease [Allorhodopirellula solitaria]|uniref:Putative permease n=1 Tax=Allorhodopirellula solitaria TaxID=2527987 RepID=A0A5C5YEI9_9BACT|nr:permease [Allorhodopirellula solitaria]TWT73349.1 putative permease [Allorhodopirellula solitaria]